MRVLRRVACSFDRFRDEVRDCIRRLDRAHRTCEVIPSPQGLPSRTESCNSVRGRVAVVAKRDRFRNTFDRPISYISPVRSIWICVAFLWACRGNHDTKLVVSPPLVPAITARAPVTAPNHLPRHHAIAVRHAGAQFLDLSADGTLIVTAGESGKASLIDRAARKVLREIGLDDHRVAGLAFGPGNLVALAYEDVGVELFDTSGKQIARSDLHSASGRIARCGNAWIVGDAKLPGARLLDDKLHEIATLVVDGPLGYEGPVACRGDHAVVAMIDRVILFSIPSRARVATLPAGDDKEALRDVAIDDRFIAAVSSSGSVWLFDPTGKRLAYRPYIAGQAHLAFGPGARRESEPLHAGPAKPLLSAGNVLLGMPELDVVARSEPGAMRRFTPDGTWLVVARDVVNVLEVAALDPPADGHPDTAGSMSIDPEGELLATGANGRIYLWAVGQAKPGIGPGPLVGVLDGHMQGTFANVTVAFAPDGKRLVSAGGGVICVWDVATRKRAAMWRLDGEGEIKWLAVTDKIVVASGSNHVYVLDATTGKQLAKLGSFKLDVADGSVEGVALHPGGEHVVVSSQKGHTTVFKIPSGELVKELPPLREGYGADVWFSPDGSHLLRASSMEPVTVYDWPALTETRSSEKLWLAGGAWSRDSKAFAWGSWTQQEVGVVDVTREAHARWKRATPWHTAAVAWDAKRNLVYSTGADNSIHVWDAKDGAHRAIWTAANGPGIEHLAFSDDGRLIVASYQDGDLRIWDASTFEVVANFPDLHIGDRGVLRLTGDRLALIDSRGALRRWQRTGKTWAPLASWEAGETSDWHGAGLTADGTTGFYVSSGEGTKIMSIDIATAKPGPVRSLRVDPSLHLTRISADGTKAVFAGSNDNDSRVELWDLVHARRLHALELPNQQLTRADFIGGDIAIDTEPRLRWSIDTGKTKADCGSDLPNLVGYSADATRALWTYTGGVRVTDASCKDQQILYVGEDVFSSAFSGNRLAIGTRSGQIVLWELDRTTPIAFMRGLRDGLWSSWSENGRIAPVRAVLDPAK
ncbi:MAG: hypothetical protein JWO36_4037 [Myxococcales bacterium]|nr:hypothetical protein [Myxococcales bacterium]